ncbi:MAG: hypothetical protein SFX73_17955 [Kofleriaceae bacterium]|nr:hypothetical protein [Kofleriaceae bacterium]
MTEVRSTSRRLLVLRFDGATCAVTASELAAIDHDGAGARISVEGPIQDLAELLPHCKSAATPLRLIVDVKGYRRCIRARAELELVETSAVYRMPNLLRECGVAPWLRGVVLLGEQDDQQPALWLDLEKLALASEQETDR